MKNCVFCSRVGAAARVRTPLTLAVLALLSASSGAQSGPAPNAEGVSLNPVVVTATRRPERLADLVADLTVIDSATLQASGAAGLAEVLARVPGVQMARTGGMGGVATVYVRGAESRFTAVLVDGVRVDSQSTGGAEWEQIPLGLIDHIEVLRGPAAAIYGSDAVAGVVQIFTRQGQAAPQAYVSGAVGSYGSSNLRAGLSARVQAWDYAVSAQAEHSRSFATLEQPGLDSSRFAYDNRAASARVGYAITPDQRLQANALVSSQTKGYVNLYDGPNYDSLGYARTQELMRSLGVQWQARWSEHYSSLLSLTQNLDHNASAPVTLPKPNDQFLAETVVRNLLWQSDVKVGAQHVTLAVERRQDDLVNNDFQGGPTLNLSRAQTGLALGYSLRVQAHTLQFNVRHDHYSAFGSHDTGGLAYGYALDGGWRATASAAVAYRAPTLFQQFSSYGTPNLQPETSRNAEVGLQYTQDQTRLGLVAYRNRVNNLIQYSTDWSCVTHCYLNAGRANMPGVTLSGQSRMGGWTLGGSLDWENPTNLDTHQSLVRRAHRYAKLDASTRLAQWTLGLEAQAVSSRRDSYPSDVQMPGFALWNVHASTQLTPDWTALLRLDNLANRHYNWVESYATAGRSVYAGLKWAPKFNSN